MSESVSLLDRSLENLSYRKWTVAMATIVGFLVICAVGVTLAVVESNRPAIIVEPDNGNAQNTNECAASQFPVNYTPFYHSQNSNLRAGQYVLLQNGTVWKATGDPILNHCDILILDGKIKQIGQKIANTMNATVYKLNGAWVTPGLVDTHSHIGVYSFPEDAWATQDGNELTNPTFPQLRAIDGLNPNDPAIDLIRSGGVTTSLVLPGSGNIQGGQAAYVKLRGETVADMLLPNAPRALKMACGENPKRVYGSSGQTPDSRMGIGWLQRHQWYSAAQLKQQQDQWNCLNAAGATSDPYPQDLSLEPLVAVLNEEALLMVHCYKVEDFEMMIRTANEFGFKISTFQHALEAWKVPEMMLANNITVATFSDNWGFKMEGFDASVKAPTILNNAGVKLALKSDHPVLFAKYLIYEAAKAHHYGLNAEAALQAVTIVPARGMGVGDRVGSLEVDKDADVVVWDRYPLQIDAQADKVFIDGELIDDYGLPQVSPPSSASATLSFSPASSCPSVTSNSYAIVGVNVYTMTSVEPVNGATIVVQNGNVTCVGVGCSTLGIANVYTLTGGIVIPGIVSTGAPVGLLEVDAEDRSGDGGVGDYNGAIIKAIDGIQYNTFAPRHMAAAWRGGVTTVVASPLGTNLISGLSVAFHSHGLVIDDALVMDETSLEINIGNNAKGPSLTGSISGQIALLRSLFMKSNGTGDNLDKAMKNVYPVVVTVDQADQIAAVIRLKKEFGFDLIVKGGAEAHLVANLLATNNVPVVWIRSPPGTFEKWQATPQGAAKLDAAGVTVAIAIDDPGSVRNLRWEAGIAVSNGLSYQKALAAITSVPAQLYGFANTGVIQTNSPANFVAFNGDPLALNSDIQLIALGNYVECTPQQY